MVASGVVLSSSIKVAKDNGATAEPQWRGTWIATAPILGRVSTLPCRSEAEALAECGELILVAQARRARGAES